MWNTPNTAKKEMIHNLASSAATTENNKIGKKKKKKMKQTTTWKRAIFLSALRRKLGRRARSRCRPTPEWLSVRRWRGGRRRLLIRYWASFLSFLIERRTTTTRSSEEKSFLSLGNKKKTGRGPVSNSWMRRLVAGRENSVASSSLTERWNEKQKIVKVKKKHIDTQDGTI